MANLQGVLLDVDGTLLDRNDGHALAWVKALQEAGIRADFAELQNHEEQNHKKGVYDSVLHDSVN